MLDKSALTNLLALLVAAAGFMLPGRVGDVLLSVGLYAVSGAITNWMAIYMLFERVPGFYGSGVIPARFTEFKAGIREMVMQQFFNPENLRQFFAQAAADQEAGARTLAESIAAKVDFTKAFDELLDIIKQSSLGGMLAMVGGPAVLMPLRDPFVSRMQKFLQDVAKDKQVLEDLHNHSSAHLMGRVEQIVDKRLDELTPQLVKEIIQRMIHKHLGWLVVWGGVVGGLIGLVVALVF